MTDATLFDMSAIDKAKRERVKAETRLTAQTAQYSRYHAEPHPDLAELHELRDLGVLLPRFGASLMLAWDRYTDACRALDEAMLDACHVEAHA